MTNSSSTVNGKKAQITIFVIVGILLLAVVGYVIYLSYSSVQKPAVKEVPAELQPLNTFVTQCIYSTAVDGLIELGKHGGYISLESQGLVVNKNDPTESDGINAFSNDVAYWWYLSSPNKCTGSCTFKTNIPALNRRSGSSGSSGSLSGNSIEEQLDAYVNENLEYCLGNFAEFRNQGIIITSEPNSVKTKTTITDKEAAFYVKYPLSIESAGKKQTLTEFYTVVPINIKKIYALAKNIAELEADSKTRFLEKYTQNLISIFSGITPDKLPSTADIRFTTTGTTWAEENVRKNMQSILTVYVQGLQVENSHNYVKPVSTDEYAQQLYRDMILPETKITAEQKTLDVEFTYLNWPIYLDLNCKAGICRPESASTMAVFVPIGIQRYDFPYDVSYPILVTLTDPEALNGKGYYFNFAMEANIRNNEPMMSDFNPITALSSDDYGDSSMLCDDKQRNSGDIKIRVKDAKTKSLIDEVTISFTSDETCVIGETSAEEFISKFPVGCGFVTFSKDGYLQKSVNICTSNGEKAEIAVELEPQRYINVTFAKKPFVKNPGWSFSNAEQPLSYEESVTLSLQRISDPREASFVTGTTLEQGQEMDEIPILPGKYIVSATLNLNRPVRIPPEKRKHCTFLGLICTEYEIPEVVFEVFPEGGLTWDSEENYFYIDPVNLDKSREIKFYLLSFTPEGMNKVDDLEQYSRWPDYSKAYSSQLQPEYIFTNE